MFNTLNVRGQGMLTGQGDHADVDIDVNLQSSILFENHLVADVDIYFIVLSLLRSGARQLESPVHIHCFDNTGTVTDIVLQKSLKCLLILNIFRISTERNDL